MHIGFIDKEDPYMQLREDDYPGNSEKLKMFNFKRDKVQAYERAQNAINQGLVIFPASLNARNEIEFEEEDAGTTFKLTVPYVMANGYYDFANGLYVGAGLGVALPKVRWQGASFTGGDSSERNVSPMVGLMAGWSYHLDYNLLLDFRYRLAMLWGPEHTLQFEYLDGNEYAISNDIGLILDNSISVGLRYEF